MKPPRTKVCCIVVYDHIKCTILTGDSNICITGSQPPNLPFIGPVLFDHSGGTFQDPIHKVSLTVPTSKRQQANGNKSKIGHNQDNNEGCYIVNNVLTISLLSQQVLKQEVINQLISSSLDINS